MSCYWDVEANLNRSKLITVAAVLVVIAGTAVLFLRSSSQTSTQEQPPAAQSSNESATSTQATISNPSGALNNAAKAGLAVTAPTGISAVGASDKSATAAAANPKPDPFDYGRTPPIRMDTNAQTRSLAGAAEKNGNPERLSVLISPKPFDAEKYKQNPASYLSVPEPGRCNQPAAPSSTTPRIRAISPTRVQIKQNEGTKLRVQAVPKMPVTWTSFDLGKFSNQLTTMTVEADQNGIAEVTFLGAPGTIADVHIVCAAPMASGQIRYTVNVVKP